MSGVIARLHAEVGRVHERSLALMLIPAIAKHVKVIHLQKQKTVTKKIVVSFKQVLII